MKWYGDSDDQEWLLRSLEHFQGPNVDYDRTLTRAIGARMKNGAVIVAINGYNGRDAELHIGGTGQWATRSYFKTMFTYFFDEMGVRRLTLRAEANNRKSNKLARMLGFVQEGVLRRAGLSGQDQILYGMIEEDCRWITREVA